MPSVTLDRAKQLFNLVNGRVCCAASAAAPCIPFVYPDDGCWGRAHEMCRLMIADGAAPDKVWIYGNLRVNSQNGPPSAGYCPVCVVCWGWHVAPTLQVSVGGGVQTYVVDPSLFEEPVPQATWAGVQGDPNAVLIASPASVFYRNQSGSDIRTDPTYSQTNSVLDTYRNELKLRVASHGPPPYPFCITKPPGTQWIGVIPGNGTQNWFTWGWPAAWHVFWTIMPLTPCPGATQLSWTTKVERATGSQCTHWITVRNLTGDPITFAGRFDVLSR